MPVIKVQNKDGKGNPNHSSETGEFVSADYAGEAKLNDSREFDKQNNSLDDDIDWDDLFSEGDPNDEINKMWNEILNEEDQKKNVEEMTNEEMIKEINECKNFFDQKGIIFDNYDNFFSGDLKLKCSNFRQLKRLMEEYPIPLEGCKFVYKNLPSSTPAQTISSRIEEKQVEINGRFDLACDFDTLEINLAMEFGSHFFNNYYKTKSGVVEQIKEGNWVDGAEEYKVLTVISHEYGHMVQNYIKQKIGVYDSIIGEINNKTYYPHFYEFTYNLQRSDFRKMNNKYSTIMKNEIKNIYKQMTGKKVEDFYKEQSRYGETSPSEFFAETFASLTCGKPTETALAMKEWLKKYF